MIRKKIDLLDILFFQNLSVCKEVKHFISTRKGGVSNPPFNSLNLGFNVGDDPKNVTSNRKTLASALGIEFNQLTFAKQTHSGNVAIITGKLAGSGNSTHKTALNNTDAIITNVPGICLITLVADCVPMIFFDPIKKVIGIAHAGWRGTLKSVTPRTIKSMKNAFGTSPGDIIVGIGPSICSNCFKVGKDVIFQTRRTVKNIWWYIKNETENGEGFFDLIGSNVRQLIDEKIPKKNIEIANSCTLENPDLFFSYRKTKEGTGRFAAGIVLF